MRGWRARSLAPWQAKKGRGLAARDRLVVGASRPGVTSQSHRAPSASRWLGCDRELAPAARARSARRVAELAEAYACVLDGIHVELVYGATANFDTRQVVASKMLLAFESPVDP